MRLIYICNLLWVVIHQSIQSSIIPNNSYSHGESLTICWWLTYDNGDGLNWSTTWPWRTQPLAEIDMISSKRAKRPLRGAPFSLGGWAATKRVEFWLYTTILSCYASTSCIQRLNLMGKGRHLTYISTLPIVGLSWAQTWNRSQLQFF
jgi:hypothetical protein